MNLLMKIRHDHDEKNHFNLQLFNGGVYCVVYKSIVWEFSCNVCHSPQVGYMTIPKYTYR